MSYHLILPCYLLLYSSFVFWFECWRYNYIATLFVCYAVHLIVTLQSPAAPAPVNVLGNPLNADDPLDGPDKEGDSSNVETPPSIHETEDFYWREAVANYQQYQGRTFHRADQLSGNMGHIRRPLPFNMQEQLHQKIEDTLPSLYITLPFFPCLSTWIILIHTQFRLVTSWESLD